MSAEKKTVNRHVGGKTIRACDHCVMKQARWYCATDDAFLCQSCDSSVHRASHLGGQHKRVLLRTASSNLFGSGEPEPPWHMGFTRRARTPRSQRSKYSLKEEGKNHAVSSLVPEIHSLDASFLNDGEDDEEHLLYSVPVFDQFQTELCNESNEIGRSFMTSVVDNKLEKTCHLDDHNVFDHPTDDLGLLEELSPDVDGLLGKEFDNAPLNIEDLGLNNKFKEEDNTTNIGVSFEEKRVKEEDKEVEAILGLDYESSMILVKEEKVRKSSTILRLNYEDVINTWADQGSPWTIGTRPQLDHDDYLHDFMVNNNPSNGGVGGREAKVWRYREKRRSRFYSKKIRYQVRKLNADKRPRMKGRFVKVENLHQLQVSQNITSKTSTKSINKKELFG